MNIHLDIKSLVWYQTMPYMHHGRSVSSSISNVGSRIAGPGALLRLVAHLFMFLLIFNEQRVPKYFVLVLTYYVNHSLSGASHHFWLWEIPCNYFPLYFSKERAYTSEGYRMFAFLSIDVKRDLIGCLW
jgi:hypothetical protein